MKKSVAVLIVILATSMLLAGKYWEDEPYTEWSANDASKMTRDSPWASTQSVTSARTGRGEEITSTTSTVGSGGPAFGGPARGTSNSGEARIGDFAQSLQYHVRFQSAKPVRMALGRMAMLNGNTDTDAITNFVETPPAGGDIVVMLALAPGQDRTELDTSTTDLLKNETFLVLKKSKKRIRLKQYLTPTEAGGTEAVFVFPREAIDVNDQEVRFITKLNSGTKLNRKFKLKDMVFEGKLEI